MSYAETELRNRVLASIGEKINRARDRYKERLERQAYLQGVKEQIMESAINQFSKKPGTKYE